MKQNQRFETVEQLQNALSFHFGLPVRMLDNKQLFGDAEVVSPSGRRLFTVIFTLYGEDGWGLGGHTWNPDYEV